MALDELVGSIQRREVLVRPARASGALSEFSAERLDSVVEVGERDPHDARVEAVRELVREIVLPALEFTHLVEELGLAFRQRWRSLQIERCTSTLRANTLP